MKLPISKIVFTGDFLRPSAGSLTPTQHENIAWLSMLLNEPLRISTGLPQILIHWDHRWANCSIIDEGFVSTVFNSFGFKPNILAWASIYNKSDLPESFELFLRNLFHGALVIGFELPPYLRCFFDRNEIFYIDCAISPIRFMDDLLIKFSSNNLLFSNAISDYGIDENEVFLNAGILSSGSVKGYGSLPPINSLLLVMQTTYDTALIHNNKFASILDFINDLDDLSKKYDHLLIKHHPLERNAYLMTNLLKLIGPSSTTEQNFYKLVSHDNVAGVVALSSGCIYEAKYFNKDQHYLLKSQNVKDSINSHLLNHFLIPDFWRKVLGGIIDTTPVDGLLIPFKPNRLRKQLRAPWGYNEIDTDIEVKWALGE